MSVLPKLFATILNARLEAEAATKQLQAYTQAGFRKDARLEDNVLLLITAIEHATQHRSPLYLLFVDLQKAYDTIDRGLLWRTLLADLDLDPALVCCLQQLYADL